MAWYHRLRNVLDPRRLSRDLDREMGFHLAERTDELIAQGMDPDKAAWEARRRFGNRTGQKESIHDVDVLVWLESVWADVKYALRALRRSPGFAVVAILSLALGIGANTAIFSLTDAVVLKSLPVRHPEELISITQGDRRNTTFTNPIWEQVRDGAIPLAGVAAYASTGFNLANGGVARMADGAWVSGGYFPMMGVRTIAGRLLTPADDRRGCAGQAVVSAGLASRQFGSAAAAVGKTISLNGHPFQVVGVTDPSFAGNEVGTSVSVYMPFCAVDIVDGAGTLDIRGRWYLNIIGRLKAGVPLAQVRAWLAANAAPIFEATLPQNWRADMQANYLKTTLSADPAAAGLSDLRDSYARALYILMVAVGVVLLIACANIANLMLARAAAREREIAIRLAIGAGRGRLIRQLLTESLLVTFVGAGLGLLFARWASALLVHFLALRNSLLWLDLSLDRRVLAFTVALAVVTGVLFGMVPAWRGTRIDPQTAMKAGGRGAAGSERRQRLGKALVVGQVALSLALVVGAGLLVGSFRRLVTLDPGFQRNGVLLVSADLSNSGLDRAKRDALVADLLRRIREIPGVSSASVSLMTPISGFFWNGDVEVPGFVPSGERDDIAYFNKVSDGYFHTLGTPLKEGRDIRPQDAANSQPVAVINLAMAQKFFHGTDAVGRQYRVQDGRGTGPWITVVGVVDDAKYGSLDELTLPVAFVPLTQAQDIGAEVVFEVRGAERAALASPIKDVIVSGSPAVSLTFRTLAEQVDASLARPRLLATLSGFFGVLALLLAVIGIYGVVSYGVTRRRNEIGIRIALGAAKPRVIRMVVGEAGMLVALGTVAGLGVTIVGTRFVASFLYGVTATDPLTIGGAALLLAASALGAATVPAWRASQVDPMEVLREE